MYSSNNLHKYTSRHAQNSGFNAVSGALFQPPPLPFLPETKRGLKMVRSTIASKCGEQSVRKAFPYFSFFSTGEIRA